MRNPILYLYLYLACGALGCADRISGEAEKEGDLASPCSQGQIFGNAQHSGITCSPLDELHVVATVEQDPHALQQAIDLGFLGVHYGAPLTAPAWLYVPSKSGYTDLDNKQTQTWRVDAYKWASGPAGGSQMLELQWSRESAWYPLDAINPAGTTNYYEQMFQPAVSGNFVYVPHNSGRLLKLNRLTGATAAVINPLAGTPFDGDSAAIVNSGLTVSGGSVYFTLVVWHPSGSAAQSPRKSYLVRVSSNDAVTAVPWEDVTFLPNVTKFTDPCFYTFAYANPVPARPWPPSPTAQPPIFQCGAQRPPVNSAPAVRADGSVIVATINNNATPYAYLVAYSFATGPIWAASLRGQIADGCGVKIPVNNPSNNVPSYCRFGSLVGVERETNLPVAGKLPSIVGSSPVIAPDGSIYVSSYSGGYDNNQGHLHRFSSSGQFLSLFDYGWDSTPAIRKTGPGLAQFEVVMDFNNFSPVTGDGTGPGLDASVARFTPDLTLLSRARVPQQDVWANDFLDGQSSLDTEGNAYALNATGDVYKFSPSGQVLASVHLTDSVEALGSEFAWGSDAFGRPTLYVGFAGVIYALGALGTQAPPSIAPSTHGFRTSTAGRRGRGNIN